MEGKNVLALVAVGCGVLIVLGLALAGLGYWWLSQKPEEVAVSVEVPTQVTAGEVFELVARVENLADEPQTLAALDLADGFLSGFNVESSEPAFASSMDVPMWGVSYIYGLEIPPGGERRVTMTLRALQPGDFSGDVDFCINSEFVFVSYHVRTVVTSADDPHPSDNQRPKDLTAP